ncbi:Octaprenyl-diphosphate synthase [Variovorax sp. PBL-H6]|uniref:polyprenyl synthetase family protein n=1 Tax=Variovorax sp. PBL-H6 TaxID=434009 RepID=UPI00131764B5|nr:polyprenyl synthetase family protein [Variovorax sp. PBL-H6]VTU28710.1 Octaprenyl-diphosphate synthase [Variovorax sp. PBL-H6]
MGHARDTSFEGTDDVLVREVLGEYGELTRRYVEAYLQQGEPGSYLYELMADYPRRTGKMLRPSLCIAMARATGGRAEDAMACAASIELMHNAMLIHDDIEDDSDERRGTPTLHALHGVPLAINAGDAMGLLSLRPLKENFHRLGFATALRIFEETERMAWETAEGQALELGWQRDNRVDIRDEDYLSMVLQKTCWLATIHPLRVGCLVGARGSLPLDPLIRVGFFFGAAFQIQDDLLNLTAGPAYGKEINGDLREGKRTLMLIHAFRQASERDSGRLARLMGKPRSARTDKDIAWICGLLERSGAMDHARSVAHALGGAALYEFDQYCADLPASRDLRFIRGLLTWVMQRVH